MSDSDHKKIQDKVGGISIALGIAILLSFVARAQAASLSYINDTQISLTAPATTLTIAAGSVADALTVNATSVMVTLSSSTGGSFTLTSASYDFTIASSSNGGAALVSCSAGTATAAISQLSGQATYTITPAVSQCATPPSSGNGGAAPVGVPGQYGLPYIPGVGIISTSTSTTSASTITEPTSPTTSSSVFSELAALEAELAVLQAEQASLGSSTNIFAFTRNLSLGMMGADVKALQEFLVSQASGLAAEKLKLHGITNTFGALTFNALKEYQKKEGITPVSGYFGPKTREVVEGIEK